MDVLNKWGEKMRLIDADSLIAWIKGSQQMTSKMKCVIAKIETMPDAVSVVHGEWLIEKTWYDNYIYRCNCCGWHEYHAYPDVEPYNFCPNCGASMLASKLDGYVGEYNAVLNAVNVIKSFLDKYEAEAGTSYWKSNIDDETLVTDWGYVEEGLELLEGYCLKLTKGADDEADNN